MFKAIALVMLLVGGTLTPSHATAAQEQDLVIGTAVGYMASDFFTKLVRGVDKGDKDEVLDYLGALTVGFGCAYGYAMWVSTASTRDTNLAGGVLGAGSATILNYVWRW